MSLADALADLFATHAAIVNFDYRTYTLDRYTAAIRAYNEAVQIHLAVLEALDE